MQNVRYILMLVEPKVLFQWGFTKAFVRIHLQLEIDGRIRLCNFGAVVLCDQTVNCNDSGFFEKQMFSIKRIYTPQWKISYGWRHGQASIKRIYI